MRIMVVDDDRGSRDSVKSFLLTLGHDVVDFENGRDAFEALPDAKVALILSDVKMPHMTGIDLVKAVSSTHVQPRPQIALFTGYGTMDSVMEALRAGAIDYLLKPVNAEDIVSVINRVANSLASPPVAELVSMSSNQRIILGTSMLAVYSPVMENVIRDSYAYHTDRRISVLVRGETGTGKELIARLVHFGNQRENLPFIDINCAAISPSLFESELFGYEAGAFTGGQAKGQKGKVDLAQGGTLFLDEVAEIPLELQGKLLRFIQEKTFYRVGGLKKLEADVRIICATNRNLEQAVSEGRFRSDLYYRLKVGQIFIPPLRERPEEILPLAQIFLEKFAAEKNKSFRAIGKKAGDILLQYDWPGNVRELSNTIEVVTTMFNAEELLPSHLNVLALEATNRHKTATKLSQRYSSIAEKITGELLIEVIAANRGNKTAAAKYLGISRRSLYRLLDRLETNLREEDDRFKICLNNMKDRVTLFKTLRNDSGTIIDFTCEFVNEAECLAYGKPREELVGRKMQEIWPGVAGRIFDEYCSICETGNPITDEQFHYQDPVNSHLTGIYERRAFRLGDGMGVVARDITRKLQSEAESNQREDRYQLMNERLNLISQMAAGIGHEVRNSLTTVRGYLQMLQNKSGVSPYSEQISTMVSELDRANSIISDYLSLAKNKAPELKIGNLNIVLGKLFPLLQADAFNCCNSIQLDTNNISNFNFDENEIRQLILNLVRNSLDAMQPGGKVTIKTYCEDSNVILVVQDTGTGIPDEIASRIGTPFITTKEKGTGLGLAVCYQIVQRHRAKLTFKTGSAGTSFFATFPS